MPTKPDTYWQNGTEFCSYCDNELTLKQGPEARCADCGAQLSLEPPPKEIFRERTNNVRIDLSNALVLLAVQAEETSRFATRELCRRLDVDLLMGRLKTDESAEKKLLGVGVDPELVARFFRCVKEEA